jgi:hypothetical protein
LRPGATALAELAPSAGEISRSEESGGSFLATYLPEFFHRHHHVAIFERDVRRRSEFESQSLGTDFFDRKVHGPITNGKAQG